MLPQPTGDLVYRIVLTADQVTGDTEIWDVITRPGIRIWLHLVLLPTAWAASEGHSPRDRLL